MSRAADFVSGLQAQQTKALESLKPWRAEVYAVEDGRVILKPFEADAPLGEKVAQLRGFDVVPGDEVIVAEVAGRLFVLGANQRGTPTARSMSASLHLKSGTQLRLYNAANSAYPIAMDGSNGNARFDGNLVVGGTLTVGGGTSSGGGPFVYQAIDGTPTTASTTSTSTWQEQGSISVTLPTGTWTVYANAWSRLQHSVGGTISSRVDIAGSQGTSFSSSASTVATLYAAQHSRTGQSGTIAVKSQYLNGAAGTAYAGASMFFVIAVKE